VTYYPYAGEEFPLVVRNDGQHDLQRLFCDWAEILKAKSRSKDL
jgi:hypothetical protein